MSIRVRIDNGEVSSDLTFASEDEAAHFLELVAYYITRESVGEMAKRFRKRTREHEVVSQ